MEIMFYMCKKVFKGNFNWTKSKNWINIEKPFKSEKIICGCFSFFFGYWFIYFADLFEWPKSRLTGKF